MKNTILDKKYYIEDGVIMVHKPTGISSFGLVSIMRKITGIKKIGHSGILDPLASGLMILGVGEGTKKIKKYIGLDKAYIAEIIIGKSTTTGDTEGSIVDEKDICISNMNELSFNNVFDSFLGKKYYNAPLYSAVKVLGKPLYKYARNGEVPPFIPKKEMYLKSFKILDLYKYGETFILKVYVDVGSGTYIRTLAEEFGKKIDYPASIKSLYRVSIYNYQDKDSYVLNN